MPIELKTSQAIISGYYEYSLGGFIDQESLWCFEIDPENLSQLIEELKLQKSETVPDTFWKMPPYYSPRKRSAQSSVFKSEEFKEERGPDGDHYFLPYDGEQQRAFVWYRFNFQIAVRLTVASVAVKKNSAKTSIWTRH